MQFWNFGSWIQRIDYGFCLPAMAKTPLFIGERLAKIRGILNFFSDYDWRSMALGHRYVRKGTYQAMCMLMPDAGRRTWINATLRRFISYSREEWEACLFPKGHRDHMQTIFNRSTIEGLNTLLEIQQKGRGIVLLTCHFDSFLMGAVLLGMHGLRINILTSSVVEDSRVHPAVQAFFANKYRGIELYLRGGRMVHFETGLRFFYRALERGEAVVILADLPAGSKKTEVIVPFLGATRRMAPGSWRMAKKTNSALGAFVCLHDGPGKYRVLSYLDKDQRLTDPVSVMTPIYEFLGQQIRLYPERWLASELLPKYECV